MNETKPEKPDGSVSSHCSSAAKPREWWINRKKVFACNIDSVSSGFSSEVMANNYRHEGEETVHVREVASCQGLLDNSMSKAIDMVEIRLNFWRMTRDKAKEPCMTSEAVCMVLQDLMLRLEETQNTALTDCFGACKDNPIKRDE